MIGATSAGNVARLVRSVGVDEDDDVAGRFVERQPQRVALALAAVRGRPARRAAAAISRVRSREWPSTTSTSSAYGRTRIDDLADQPFFVLGGDSDLVCGHCSADGVAFGVGPAQPAHRSALPGGGGPLILQ